MNAEGKRQRSEQPAGNVNDDTKRSKVDWPEPEPFPTIVGVRVNFEQFVEYAKLHMPVGRRFQHGYRYLPGPGHPRGYTGWLSSKVLDAGGVDSPLVIYTDSQMEKEVGGYFQDYWCWEPAENGGRTVWPDEWARGALSTPEFFIPEFLYEQFAAIQPGAESAPKVTYTFFP